MVLQNPPIIYTHPILCFEGTINLQTMTDYLAADTAEHPESYILRDSDI